MKTEAIRQIIDEFLRLIYKGVVVYEDEPDNDWKDCASDARVELKALVDLIREAIAINNESDPGDYDRMDAWEARAREAL